MNDKMSVVVRCVAWPVVMDVPHRSTLHFSRFSSLGDSHGSMTSARESLDGHDLVVKVIGVEARPGPEVEVVGHGHSAR
jgi:hypothetical protein